MLFKKDHHLLPLVNILIRRTAEAGLILKWKADYEYTKFKEGLNDANARNDHEKPLSIDHVLVSANRNHIEIVFKFQVSF
jgi:hypothetical protein